MVTPPVNCLTILSLRPMKVAMSICGFSVMELLGRIQQRLRRDATDVEAGTAEGGLAVLADEGVDHGGLEAQLRGADRGHIARGARTDDDDVELVAHCFAPDVTAVSATAQYGVGT
jgi:hypothetical protein